MGLGAMAVLVLTVVFHKRIFSPIPWDYTRWDQGWCFFGGGRALG